MLKGFLTEIFLTTSTLFLLLFDSHLTNSLKYKFPLLEKEIFIQIQLIFYFLLCLIFNNHLQGVDSSQLFIFDNCLCTVKFIFIFLITCVFIFIWRGFLLQRLNLIEYFILFLFSIIASLILLNTTNFLSVYLCIELQSLCFYILTAYQRKSIYSSEAGLKYFSSNAVISGIFLFGTLIFYGLFGTSNFEDISLILNSYSFIEGNHYFFQYCLWGSICIFITFFFKLTIATYHAWFPQIYDGAPLSSTIILNFLPKLVIFTIFLRFWESISLFTPYFESLILLIGVYSVFFGIIKGLKQKRLKKLFIYSSISQMGLPLCALGENTLTSKYAVFFFLIIYLITAILMWGILVLIASNQKKRTIYWHESLNIYPIFLNAFTNVKQFNSSYSFCLIFLFFSMAGIPPCVGFLSKIYIYFSLIETFNYEIATILAYTGAFGVYYYIKILKISFFEQENLKSKNKQQTFFDFEFLFLDFLLFAICIYFLIYICFFPNILNLICKYSIIFLSLLDKWLSGRKY